MFKLIFLIAYFTLGLLQVIILRIVEGKLELFYWIAIPVSWLPALLIYLIRKLIKKIMEKLMNIKF